MRKERGVDVEPVFADIKLNQRKASESDALIDHLQHGKKIMGRYPSVAVGDSAYGSEENYAFLEGAEIGNYLKYNTYHIERTKKYRENPYRKENFAYDEKEDIYRCVALLSMAHNAKKIALLIN